MINLTRALQYPFAGSNWIFKAVVGALLTAIWPVGFVTLFILLGYQLRIIRDVIDERDAELPEWDQIGEDFGRGVMVLLGTLVYYLPAFALIGLGAVFAAQSVESFDVTDYALYRIGPDINRERLAFAVIFWAVAMIWMLLSAPLVMAATARYAETRQFSAFTQVNTRFTEVWACRAEAGSLMLNLFVLGVITQVVTLMLSTVVPMLCVLNAFLQFIYFVVVWHLAGQWGLILKNERRHNIIRPLKR